MNFEAVIDQVIQREGGDKYTNDPADAGKETRWGITIAVARANKYMGPMKDLPESLAREIYRRRFIVAPWFDQVALVDEKIGAELIDTGVNAGPPAAATSLQRWLNGFNESGSHYADVFVDGRIGQVTIDSLRAFLRWRGADGTTAMLRGLNSTQGAFYLSLAEANKLQRKYLFGWVMGRVS